MGHELDAAIRHLEELVRHDIDDLQNHGTHEHIGEQAAELASFCAALVVLEQEREGPEPWPWTVAVDKADGWKPTSVTIQHGNAPPQRFVPDPEAGS